MKSDSTPDPEPKLAGEADSAGCAPTDGSRVPTCEDGPIVDSSWDYDDDESDDDTTDLSDCGMIYDNAFGFECELSGSEQCEFCPNRAAVGRENVEVTHPETKP